MKSIAVFSVLYALLVTGAHAAPGGTNDVAEVVAGQTVTVDVLANDFGNNLTIDLENSSVVYPARKSDFSVIDNKLVYTNNLAGNGSPVTGIVQIYYVMKNALNETNWAELAITVVNDVAFPVGSDDVAQVAAGGSVTIDVLANDSGNNLTIDLESSGVEYPVKKTDFTVVDNKLVYTNNADVEGNPVLDPVILYYILRDSLNRITWAKLTVNIIGESVYPISRKDTAIVQTGQSITIDVLANDTGENLSLVSATPSWPVTSDQISIQDNKLVYSHSTPNQSGYAVEGQVTIYYVVQDSSGRTNWSEVTVDIVSNQVIKTYLLAGQSNAGGFGLGYGDLQFGTLLPNENLDDIGRSDLIAAQSSGGMFSRYFANWRGLEPGFGAGNGFRFGAELSFNSKLQQTISEPIRIIKHTAGGTTMFSDWQPNIVNNTYSDFMETIDRAKVAANELGITLDIQGLLLVQGESDSFGQEMPLAYSSRLQSFISGLREDLNVPDLQVHIGEIPDSPIWIQRQQIWAAQREVASSDPNVFLVESRGLELLTDDSYGGDQVHWSTRGNVALGELFADSVISAELAN